ncbi:TPA: tetratricopeptide repeat protein [Candidatus Micrarchaeota archaeon]|nr:tetratricopeptide repeat protein [Candidatus Micrarchaeota archaeon]
MPDDQVLIPQQTRRPPMGEEIRRERLRPENENRELTTTKSLDKLAPQTQINPMLLDPRYNEEINRNLERALVAYYPKRPITDLTTTEKINLVLSAMKDRELFGFSYISNPSVPPKTAEETYALRQGDCDELSRIFVILGERVGLNDISQFYVNFRDRSLGEDFGHAGVFYVEGSIFYIDPATDKKREFGQKFKTLNQAMADQSFRRWITDIGLQTSGRTGKIEINDIGAIPGKAGCEALYYFEYGAYTFDNQKWREALENFKKAEEKGMKSARVYFNIGQAYYQLDLYSEAASYFEQAVKKKTDANYYEYLGSSYFHATNYKKAVEAFSAQLKFEPNNRAALLSLGTACNEAAEKAMNDGAEQDAFVFFMRAKSPLMKIAHDQNSTQIERENAKKLLESVDSRLKELKTKIK